MTILMRPHYRIHFPYCCLSSFKQQQRLNRLASDLVSQNEVQKNPNVKGKLWSGCVSYVCQINAKEVIKKLDIDSVIRKEQNAFQRKETNNLVTLNHVLHNKNKDYNMENSLYRFENIIDCNLQQSYFHLYNQITGNIRNETTNIKSLVPVMNKSLSTFQRISSMQSKRFLNDLPSAKQLDDMMEYFVEEAPNLFKASGWSYRNCSYKIVFENNVIGTKTESLNAYILQINVMRNLTRLLLRNPELNIVRINKNINDGSIHIRWQVDGIPRYLRPFSLFGIIDEKRFLRSIDGYSMFFMKNDGLYHRHVLMNMTPLKYEKRKSLLSQILAGFGLSGYYGYPKQPAFPTFQEQGIR